MKRTLCLILAMLMCLSVLVACGTKSEEPAATTTAELTDASTEATTAAVTEEAEPIDPIANRTLEDEVPEYNFNGAKFRTLVQTEQAHDIAVESQNGEMLNDAIYNRNLRIQERFNIVIESTTGVRKDIEKAITASVASGDDTYELVLQQMFRSCSSAVAGHFLDWHQIPHVDLSKPWYVSSVMEEGVGTINGKAYLAVSDILMSYVEKSAAMIYDQVAAAEYGITNVYEVVMAGKWTHEQLNIWTQDIYQDLNNNAQKDDKDFYGLVYINSGCPFLASAYGYGVRFVEMNGDNVQMVLNSERNIDVFDSIYTMLQKSGVYSFNDDNTTPQTMMKNGQGVFATMQLVYAKDVLNNTEHDCGVIPLPKWNEEQESYYSVADGGCNIIAVMTTVKNLEMVGAVTEALSAESWRSVMPVLRDVTLGVKMARDPQCLEMIELVLNSRYIDFAYLYDNSEGWVFNIADFIQTQGGFASTYKRMEKPIQKYYERVIKAIG